MPRLLKFLLQLVTALCLFGAIILAGASDFVVALRKGTAHHRALGWTGAMFAVGAFGGTLLSLISGRIKMSGVNSIKVDFTADRNPAGFFAYIVEFFLAGIIAVAFAVYQFKQS